MKSLNIISRSVLLALAIGAPAVLAETYYIPHKVLEKGTDRISSITDLQISNSGEIVAKSTSRKPLYWSKYDNPSQLIFASNTSLTGNIENISISDDGDISATYLPFTFNPQNLAEWTAPNHTFSRYLGTQQQYMGIKRNNNNQAVMAVGTGATSREVVIYDYSTGLETDTNLSLVMAYNGIYAVNGLNDEGSVIVYGTFGNHTGSAYYTVADGPVAAKGRVTNTPYPYDYWDYYSDLNNQGDVVGYIAKTYDQTVPSEYKANYCLYENIQGETYHHEFTALELINTTPFSTYCGLASVNNNGIAAGNFEYRPSHTTEEPIRIPFIWNPSNQQSQSLIDLIRFETDVQLGDLYNLKLVDINDNGDIIGVNEDENNVKTYYYFSAKIVLPPPPPPPPAPPINVIIDNDDIFSATFSQNWVLIRNVISFLVPIGDEWQSASTIADYVGADYSIVDQSDGFEKSFTWNYMISKQANYELSVNIPADSLNDGAATYVIKSGSTVLGSVTLDQTVASSTSYQALGSYNLPAGAELEITVNGSGNGNLVADAIQLQEL